MDFASQKWIPMPFLMVILIGIVAIELQATPIKLAPHRTGLFLSVIVPT